jgi:hypothetical protein
MMFLMGTAGKLRPGTNFQNLPQVFVTDTLFPGDRSKFGKVSLEQMISPTLERKWSISWTQASKKERILSGCAPLLEKAKEVFQFWNSHVSGQLLTVNNYGV